MAFSLWVMAMSCAWGVALGCLVVLFRVGFGVWWLRCFLFAFCGVVELVVWVVIVCVAL